MNEQNDVMNVEEKTKQQVETKDVWQEAFENEPWLTPLIDIHETEENFYLTANMPGVNKENIKITAEDDSLVLMGRINFDDVVKRNYVRKETKSGNYYRKLKISDAIDVEKVSAEMINGQLVVILPKHDRVKPREIKIN